MGKNTEIYIKESLSELKSLYKKTKSYRKKLRILSLILTKEMRFTTREHLAIHLGVDVKTLYVWTKTYNLFGLKQMLVISSGGKRREIVPAKIYVDLEKKLHNSNSPLLGYTDAVEWIRNEFNIDLNYHTLRSFMIRHYGTKLKTPRKSHYKKDEKAFETFKKTSGITQNN